MKFTQKRQAVKRKDNDEKGFDYRYYRARWGVFG